MTVREHFSRIYEETKAAACVKPDDAPYPDPAPEFRMVAASNNWWKQWFEDTTPMIDHLAAGPAKGFPVALVMSPRPTGLRLLANASLLLTLTAKFDAGPWSAVSQTGI